MIDPKRLLKYLGYAFTLLILGLIVFSAVDYAQGVQPFFTVSDSPSSMSPTINHGDAVMVYGVAFHSLHAGDIIVFKDPRGGSQTIVHRIVAVQDDGNGSTYLLTKGDNTNTNPTIDPWKVTQQYYLSKVILVVPLVGYISPALWGLSGFSAILPIAFVVILLLLFSSLRIKEENKENSQEPDDGGCPKS
jgi:signal peptidase I